jgi:translation initiation factor 1
MRLFEGTPFDIPPKCDRCGELERDCGCPPQSAPSVAPEHQTARLCVEKRKRGKVVTIIRGLVDDASLVELLSTLKAACGAGGTSKDGVLEIQGDHLERVKATLLAAGYRVKA